MIGTTLGEELHIRDGAVTRQLPQSLMKLIRIENHNLFGRAYKNPLKIEDCSSIGWWTKKPNNNIA